MSEEQIRQLLHAAKLKYTSGRAELIALLIDAEGPLTQEEIAKALPKLNKATIYRILDALLQAGQVHRLQNGNRVWQFAFCGCGNIEHTHCHPHFVCRICGKVECLKDVKIPLFRTISEDYRIEEQEIYFKGVCPSCK